MNLGLRPRMFGASALLAVFIAVSFAVLLVEIQRLDENGRLARRAADVAATANRLENLAIDLQTAGRGFVITGDDRFLEPRVQASILLPQTQTELERLILDEGQAALARTIGRKIEAYDREFLAPVIALARVDRERARRRVAEGEGKRRVDEIRRDFDRFRAREEAISEERLDRSAAARREAYVVGASALAASTLLVLLFAAYLGRAIIRPVRGVAQAAERLAAGERTVRVPGGGAGEIRGLTMGFNHMAESLHESHVEIEAQRSELEDANAELEAQQAELERAVAELADEKERVQMLYEFGEALATEIEVDAVGESIVRRLCDLADAEFGALYVADDEHEVVRLVASRGADPRRLAATVEHGEGLPGRALAEARTVQASHGDAGLRVAAFGDDVTVRHELHVPLTQGGRVVGLLTLARLADRPFTATDLELVEPLADQSAIALASALAYDDARRLANLNSAVLDATSEGIRMVDLAGRTLLANAAMRRLAEDVLRLPEGRSIYEQTKAVAERTADPDAYLARMGEIAADPEFEAVDEYELVDTGEAIQRYTGPVRGTRGEAIGRIFVVRDISEARQAERLKSELVATVSHELRTPLASIFGFSELMANESLDAETQTRYAETIHEEARRLTNLINDFLDVQRIEEGALTLDLQRFDLRPLLRQAVDLFAAQSPDHSLRLEVADEPIEVVGERDRVAQVAANFVSNAIKYSPAGGDVVVTAESRNGLVRVAVADGGIGIPPEQQGRIFTKFFRVDSSDTRRIGGTGLGLALSREIIEAHGGRVGFDSVEGEGSTFWFELPAGAGGAAGGAPSVLVVEDDAAAASMIATWLEEVGYDVDVVATGEEAIERVGLRPPHAVCLDIGLGGALDGWEVLARLKERPATASVPVVICTGGHGGERASALGAADFLTKPVAAADLQLAISRVLPAGTGRVLVVDDDPGVRRLVVETLAAGGFETGEAHDGEAALTEIERRRPDALVLDLMMPRVDGFAVLERLQRDPSMRAIPVIVLTARRLSAAERSLLRTRAVSVLNKSTYSARELRRLVDRAVGR